MFIIFVCKLCVQIVCANIPVMKNDKKKLEPLFNFAVNGVTVAAICDNRDRKGTVIENYPVKIRVTFRRDRKYYSTGKRITKPDWETLKGSKSKDKKAIRSDIQASFELVQEEVKSLFTEKGYFSFSDLAVRLGKVSGQNINTAFKAKIESLTKEGREGSKVFFNSTLLNIEAFAGDNIPFQAVTTDFLKRFEKQLALSGRNYTTIGMYMRHLRVIVNEAIRSGVIKIAAYPFGKDKYEITTGEGRKLALNLQQIKQVITFTDGTSTMEQYRDLWFFSYLCNGANFADILKLKYSNIQAEEIRFLRSKTVRTSKVKKEIIAIVSPEMQAIINRWGNNERKPDNHIFPYLKGKETPLQEKKIIADITKRTNKKLKVIGKSIGVDNLSTYSARHSFATVLKRSGTNIAYISESLGHGDIKTTENYLASFEKSERLKAASYLTNFDNLKLGERQFNQFISNGGENENLVRMLVYSLGGDMDRTYEILEMCHKNGRWLYPHYPAYDSLKSSDLRQLEAIGPIIDGYLYMATTAWIIKHNNQFEEI